jgi:membrane fusion protein, multidrug efflux system
MRSHALPWLLAALLALPLAAATSACGPGADDDSADDDSADDDDSSEAVKATPVRAVAVVTGEISETIASSSTVDSERRADIHAEASGTIETLVAEEGDRVRAGGVLATLRNPTLQGELERAEGSFARAEEEFQAAKALYDQGFLSRNEHEAASHALETSRVTVEQARATHEARSITSPIAGTVSLRQVRYGEAVSPGQLAFQVVDLTALRVEVNLPEKDLSRLHKGQLVRIRSEVLDESEEVTGRLQRISPVVDPLTGTVKVTVAVDPSQQVLRPGMFVNVDIVVDTHEEARLVPKRALVYDEGEPLAFVVKDSIVARTPITLGFADRDLVEVTSGLEPGDQVVVIGQGLLRDGSEVRIVE